MSAPDAGAQLLAADHPFELTEETPEQAPWGVAAEEFAPQATYSHVFDTPGVYPYVCTIHGVRDKGMAGTIIVTE